MQPNQASAARLLSRKASAVILPLFLYASSSFAQSTSSSLQATVTDSSGAAIVGAECLITNEATQAALTVKSDSQGTCLFPNVQSGSYGLRVTANGFKVLESRDIQIAASQARTLGRLTLDVGTLSESVNVTAEVSQINLSTAEKAGTINEHQLQNIAIKGRDFFALLNTVPGVVDNFSQKRDASSPDALRGTFINGARENQKNLAVDGITDMDTGSNNTIHFQPNMDSISEIRVLTSNYQAEFGRNSGGVVTVITKGGQRDFHGTAYDFYRHESLNANSFFNNRTGTQKAPYRFRVTGYTIGGPVTIPKLFNRDRNKLFFFWSEEWVGRRVDYGTRFVNVPTALERQGDFSKSFDSSGKLITIIDPTTGQAFPGNTIPKGRINPLGQSILNFFPLPNYTDPDPKNLYTRNYRSQYSGAYPRRDDLVRLDYNITPSLQVYWRYVRDKDEQQVPYGSWVNGSVNFNVAPITFGQPGDGHVIHATKMFTPTLINEFIFGKSHNNLYFYPTDPTAVDRSKLGNPAEWYKDTATGVSYLDAQSYMPNLLFGGQPASVVNVQFGNIPYENFNDIYSFVDNVSKVYRSHNLKAGIYVEHTRKYQVGGGNNRGQFDFSTNANNPYDTKDSYANALIGQLNAYSEATARVNGDWRFWNFEWFAQDNWKVSKRLTLDIGFRFYHLPPQADVNHTSATFDPSLYSRANAPLLYAPAIDPATGKRVAINPATGALAATPLIGLFVPGTGNVANGAAIGGVNGYPEGLYTVPAVSIAPRVGFAYDLFGNGRTAVRGGFGMFRDRMQGNPIMNTNGNPPVAFTPTQYFGTLDSYANSGGATGPTNVSTLLGSQGLATMMNYSFGIQHQIWGMAVDASYVGSAGYHLLGQININPIPIGARFNPANFDPTNPGKPLPDNFLRPYIGWGDINLRTNAFNSNYNSFQLSVNKQFSKGLQFGIAYTRSKALGVASTDTSGVSPYFAPRSRNYGPLDYDRPNVFVANYIYDLPKIGQYMHFRPASIVLDGWQVSGVTVAQSGNPFTPGLGFTTTNDVTGSTEGARVNVVGDPKAGETGTFYHWFNQSAFSAPAAGTFGNAGPNILRNPSFVNFDLSVTKRFNLGSEQRWLQFRTEMFNAFNHTQYAGVDTGTSFNPTTGAQTNPNFGVITSTRDPRIIQLSLKLYF